MNPNDNPEAIRIMVQLAHEFSIAKRKCLDEQGHDINFAIIGDGIAQKLMDCGVNPNFEMMEFGPVWHWGVAAGIAACTHATVVDPDMVIYFVTDHNLSARSRARNHLFGPMNVSLLPTFCGNDAKTQTRGEPKNWNIQAFYPESQTWLDCEDCDPCLKGLTFEQACTDLMAKRRNVPAHMVELPVRLKPVT